MPAQQKPKKATGERNSQRKNGKSPSKELNEVRMIDGISVPKIGPNGVRNWGKGAPSGKSVMGYALPRAERMASNRGLTLDQWADELRRERTERKARKRAARHSFPVSRSVARALKGLS